MMSPAEVREQYGRELVNLRNESRFVFLNTLFSISEAVLYMQVERAAGPWAAGRHARAAHSVSGGHRLAAPAGPVRVCPSSLLVCFPLLAAAPPDP